jgi:hypothetical protein
MVADAAVRQGVNGGRLPLSRSHLYAAQLCERLGPQALAVIGHRAPIAGQRTGDICALVGQQR